LPTNDDDIQSDELYIQGFILNKLYTFRFFGKRGNITHGGHTELANIPKGYPPKYKGMVFSVAKEMNGKYVLIFKSTGSDHICALNEDDAIQEGLKICNSYRTKVGLNPLSRRFEEMKKPEPIDESKEEKIYHKLSEKEKRAKAWLEKWKKEQGVP
jgi:hypothetical protein